MEPFMLKRSLSVLAGLAISVCAIAQTQAPAPAPVQLGTVDNVQGLVTMSDGTSIGNVVNGNAVLDGSRFVTSSSGSAVLKMSNGCDIRLKPSQSLTVQSGLNCDALVAAIQSLEGNNAVFAALSNPLVGIGTLASAALIATARNGGPISGQ
jgi:hypothetical protein